MTDRSGITAYVGSLLGTLAVALGVGALLLSRLGTMGAAAVALVVVLLAGATDLRAVLRQRAPRETPAREGERAEAPLARPARATT